MIYYTAAIYVHESLALSIVISFLDTDPCHPQQQASDIVYRDESISIMQIK